MSVLLHDHATWDDWWSRSADFHRYHPGARHRRRLITAEVRRFVSRRPGKISVLDVGCGDGLLLRELESKFSSLVQCSGADYLPATIALAQRTNPTISFNVLDIEKSALEERFDVVICAEVIEHLRERRAAFLNLASMVAPGGLLIVTTPQGPIFPTETFFGHKTHSARQEMASLGNLSGLQLIRCLEWGWPLYNLLKFATNIWPQKSLSAFGSRKYSWWQRAVTHFLFSSTSPE